jgi:hypothetical protein
MKLCVFSRQEGIILLTLFNDTAEHDSGGHLIQEDENGSDTVIQCIRHQLLGAQVKWQLLKKII